MKSYLLTTGVLFTLITLAHLARMIGESRALATDPFYLAITLVAAALALWAFRLLRRSATH